MLTFCVNFVTDSTIIEETALSDAAVARSLEPPTVTAEGTTSTNNVFSANPLLTCDSDNGDLEPPAATAESIVAADDANIPVSMEQFPTVTTHNGGDLLLTCDADDGDLEPPATTAESITAVNDANLTTDELLLICATDDAEPVMVIHDNAISTDTASGSLHADQAPVSSTEGENISNTGDDTNLARGSRKRKRDEANWLCNVRKRLRNSGCSYVNKSKKYCKRRNVRPLAQHAGCRRKCLEKVSEENRATLFNGFWKLGDFDAQNVFLARSVRQENVARRRPRRHATGAHLRSPNPKKKNQQVFDKNYCRSYYVNVGGRDVKVCKEFFLATFDVSSGRLNRAVVKQTESGGVSPGDTRGRYEHSKHRLPKEDIERAKDHIRSFPAYASHYTRAQSQKKYLSSDLNLAKMYKLYESHCHRDGIQPLKLWAYRHIFNNSFNLSFHHPVRQLQKV